MALDLNRPMTAFWELGTFGQQTWQAERPISCRWGCHSMFSKRMNLWVVIGWVDLPHFNPVPRFLFFRFAMVRVAVAVVVVVVVVVVVGVYIVQYTY
ncbi:hypothetical protein BDV23DRAFT_155095 [Aspergillus alliaceus]|uniref:Uncharacterized protein n=1 Tax=Petromyces alliaceus TaxID=209559 RepID=A0A5N7C8L4_PETAA|nr:hypothetical protein BDV23DRAFT_155095 [Aspergillus alliaceus]